MDMGGASIPFIFGCSSPVGSPVLGADGSPTAGRRVSSRLVDMFRRKDGGTPNEAHHTNPLRYRGGVRTQTLLRRVYVIKEPS